MIQFSNFNYTIEFRKSQKFRPNNTESKLIYSSMSISFQFLCHIFNFAIHFCTKFPGSLLTGRIIITGILLYNYQSVHTNMIARCLHYSSKVSMNLFVVNFGLTLKDRKHQRRGQSEEYTAYIKISTYNKRKAFNRKCFINFLQHCMIQ